MAALTGHRTDQPAPRSVKTKLLSLRERIRREIDAALLTPFIDASLVTIAERIAIRRRVRRGLCSQRWNKHYSRTGKNGNTVTKIPHGLENYSIGGRNDRTFNTDSDRGKKAMGANEKTLRVIPIKPAAKTAESFA